MVDIIIVKDPIYKSWDGSVIDCIIVLNDENSTELPFTATNNDPEPHGRELWSRLRAGNFGTIRPYRE